MVEVAQTPVSAPLSVLTGLSASKSNGWIADALFE